MKSPPAAHAPVTADPVFYHAALKAGAEIFTPASRSKSAKGGRIMK
jgi:hypothetical protein